MQATTAAATDGRPHDDAPSTAPAAAAPAPAAPAPAAAAPATDTTTTDPRATDRRAADRRATGDREAGARTARTRPAGGAARSLHRSATHHAGPADLAAALSAGLLGGGPVDLTPLDGARDGQLDGQQGRRPLGRLGSPGSAADRPAPTTVDPDPAVTTASTATTAPPTTAAPTAAADATPAGPARATAGEEATPTATAAAEVEAGLAASLALTRAIHLLREGRVADTLATLAALTDPPAPGASHARLPLRVEVGALATTLDAHLGAGDLGSALDVGRALHAVVTTGPATDTATSGATSAPGHGSTGAAPCLAGDGAGDATGHATGDTPGDTVAEAVRQHALAELCAASGDQAGAVEHAGAAGRLAPDAAPADLPWRASLAMALARAGRRSEADRWVREHLDAADRSGSAYARAGALRTRASLLAGPERSARLEEARALLADRPDLARLAAQVDVDLAGVLALTPGGAPRAVELLRTAEAFASDRGLWPLHGRVRRLLEHLGESPRRIADEVLAPLGARERRVAELAIAGSTNRQVAEDLGVTVKAVEWHLSRVYRKLGVTSRAGLRALLES